MTRTAFDVSDPAGPVPGFDICCFYIGGPTPHVWTKAQLDAQPARWRLPIWLLDLNKPAPDQAAQCSDALDQVGCPKGVAVALDLETFHAAEMVNGFADRLHYLDRFTIVYGSPGSLFYNPVRSGYWVADPTGKPHMYEHPHTVGTQWTWKGSAQDGQRIDESLFTDGLALWDTRPPVEPPAPTGKAEVIRDLASINTAAVKAIDVVQAFWK